MGQPFTTPLDAQRWGPKDQIVVRTLAPWCRFDPLAAQREMLTTWGPRWQPQRWPRPTS